MSRHPNRIARAISRFVENPVTNLVKGITLLLIGLTDASRTFIDDLGHPHLRVGHGLIILGIFGILGALPHFIEGLEAGKRYLDLRDQKTQPEHDPGVGPESGEDRAR
jgi:hypothetical protein